MSFSIFALIPLDIYLGDKIDAKNNISNGVLYYWWAFSYWSGYLLNWLIIPLIQGYVIAGEFGRADKIYRSIIINVPFYILYCLSFIGLLVALVIIDKKTNNKFNILESQGIIAVLIALSLAFGYFCLVCLLGYALVKIPIMLWQQSTYERKLPRLYFKISIYEDKITDQQNKVSKLVNITNLIQVEPEIEVYKKLMLFQID